MTTRDKVNKAFADLRNAGYFAEQDFLCCQSCAWSAIPDGEEKVVFYHTQDNEAWSEENDGELDEKLYLAWSGDAEEIVAILVSNGLKVEHDGSENSRIKVLP